MSTQEPQEPQFSEEELRAIEAEMEKVTVDDVLLQTIVSLLNLGARKAGLGGPPGEPAREPELGPIRDALSRLQMFYAQRSGGAAPAGEQTPPQKDPGTGSAQSSGRLWVPGQ